MSDQNIMRIFKMRQNTRKMQEEMESVVFMAASLKVKEIKHETQTVNHSKLKHVSDI